MKNYVYSGDERKLLSETLVTCDGVGVSGDSVILLEKNCIKMLLVGLGVT